MTREQAVLADPVLTMPELQRALHVGYYKLIRAAQQGRLAGAYFPFDSPRLGYRFPVAGVLDYARQMGIDEDIVRARIDTLVAQREDSD